MNGRWKALWLSALVLCVLSFPAAVQAAAALPATPAPPATLLPPTLATPEITAVPATPRPYLLGDSGEDVYSFKLRLQTLGYFREDSELSDKISEKTLERVNDLLQDNGMEPVTVISTAIQEMIFARDDLAIVPLPTPTRTPLPLIAPEGTPPLPPLTADGFLADAEGEYVFADAQDGLWYYISPTLYVNIRRYNDRGARNIWYETEVKTRGGEALRSYLTDSLRYDRSPVEIARKNSAVVAFTDDYFSIRNYGIAIRGGEIFKNYVRKTSKSYPLGDLLAVFGDGSMRAYAFDAVTAEELLAMGAEHVLTFGPWLLQDGVINERVIGDKYMHYHEPRSALGMIEPGHYFILTVDGRYTGAIGVYIGWLAARMQEVGVTEAINLDGGGTAALVFMGLQVSRVATDTPDGENSRHVTSMMGFGVSDAVPEQGCTW